MKPKTYLFFVILILTCFPSCRAPDIQEPSIWQNTSGLQDASVCQLLESPGSYSGRTIRVKAVYRYGFEWSELYSLKCSNDKRIWVEREDRKCEKAGTVEEMEYAGMGGRTYGIVAEGTLIEGDELGYGHFNSFDYLFRIQCFEKAVRLDGKGYVPGSLSTESRKKVEAFEGS